MPKPVNPVYGWTPEPEASKEQNLIYALPRAGVKFPPELILENVADALNQTTLGSCTAHGIIGNYLTGEKKNGIPFWLPSTLGLYYDERAREGTVNEDAGAIIKDGIKVANQIGLGPATIWPYNTDKFAEKPPPEYYAAAQKNRIKYYANVINSSVDNLKLPIFHGNPVTFGFQVYQGFEDYTDGVLQLPSPSERYLGGHCFTGDTKISLANGEEKTLFELSLTHYNKEFWVYSCDERGNVVPGKAHSPRKTGDKMKIICVKLDNDSEIKCTEDHLFLMRNGKYKKAKELFAGDSLMPLYRRLSESKNGEMDGYEQICNPKNKKWHFTHRSFAMQTKGWYNGVIHHSDFNKRNNDPSNLEIMSWDEHTKLHSEQTGLLQGYSKSEKGRQKSKELMKALWSDPVWREKRCKQNGINGSKTMKKNYEENKMSWQKDPEKMKAIRSINGKNNISKARTIEAKIKMKETIKFKMANDPEYAKKKKARAVHALSIHNQAIKDGKRVYTEKQINARRENCKVALAAKMAKYSPNNHKVISIADGGYEDVYDITVEKYHNFALTAGVFVHNCVYYYGYSDEKQAFLCRNSWGQDWGILGGSFWLSYQYITSSLCDDFWVIRLS